jgi:Ribonuclease G/E
MKREILISATPQETRVAILEDDTLVELMVDRPESERIVGDIYLGAIQAVLPGYRQPSSTSAWRRRPSPRFRCRSDSRR